MAVRTVKVSNASLGATAQDIKEFFSFSGDIEYVEMHSDNERSQIAYVTFKEPQGAETAVLLSDVLILKQHLNALSFMPFSFCMSFMPLMGATIVDQSVTIELAPDYKLPAGASAPSTVTESKTATDTESAFQKAEDVVSGMLAKGFILGKDALNRAKSFDEKHQFTSTTTSKVASLDQKIGLTEKIYAGTTLVGDKMKEVDEKFRVSETTKSAFAAAEQRVSSAGSAIMKNKHVFTGVSWVTGAFNRVSKAAGEVGQKTKEKVSAEEENARKAQGYAEIHESDSPKSSVGD